MLLLQLPIEVLIQIFDCVGSSYFYSDLSRLAVCKQWNELARDAWYRNFHVGQKTLRRLLSSPYVESRLALVKDNVETLDLELKGFEDWRSADSKAVNVSVSTWNGAHARAVREAWATELNNDLVYLATIVKQSRKLRILRIQATSELHPLLHLLDRRGYLFMSTIDAFVSANNLTSLDLDLCGTLLEPHPTQEHGERSHVCTSIASLLTTLRHLRLRMRSICADVLKPQQHSSKLHLNEMLINLSLSNGSPRTASTAHDTCCGSSPGGFLQLKAEMEKQAQILVTQMAAPKTVRILTHELASIELRAFDVLTGNNVRLGEGAEWDDDGEIIEDDMYSHQWYPDASFLENVKFRVDCRFPASQARRIP